MQSEGFRCRAREQPRGVASDSHGRAPVGTAGTLDEVALDPTIVDGTRQQEEHVSGPGCLRADVHAGVDANYDP